MFVSCMQPDTPTKLERARRPQEKSTRQIDHATNNPDPRKFIVFVPKNNSLPPSLCMNLVHRELVVVSKVDTDKAPSTSDVLITSPTKYRAEAARQ
mmetsp:Transcript_51851/g.77411  ORF Transcript_51851/g.77411 Transcript_51851/m.77411 type:complete len:96 (-) Transcript_51851:83-370(-)